MITTTAEMFKADNYGSTFFFIDFDYGGKATGVDGVSLSYLEIARNLKFWDHPFAVHAEFNGGMIRTTDFSAPLNNAYLLGGNYTFNNDSYTHILSLLAMYKYIESKHNDSFQLTAVWELQLLRGRISVAGFADFWREDNTVFDRNGHASQTKYVFLTEPQIWYNIDDHLSTGSEIEISSNFSGHKGLMVNPTLALKWTF